MPVSNVTSNPLPAVDQQTIARILHNLRSLEDQLLATGVTGIQRGLIGQMRHQRQQLWPLVAEENAITAHA